MKMARLSSQVTFTVRRQEPRLILPAKPTPSEVKQLSDLDDQEGLRFHMPSIAFFRNTNKKGGNETYPDPVKVIRDALAHALVYYYPLAGRLKEGDSRKLMVDCTGELGVLFIEADADITLEHLGDAIQPPCPYLEHFLYDIPGSSGIIGCPLMLIQVTRLACGGFIVATRVNHTMTDALGIFYFLNTIGEIARGANEPSYRPVWKREILNARDPPRVTCVHHEYDTTVGTEATMDTHADLIDKSFFFGFQEIDCIRKHLPSHLQSSSTFEVLIACIWKCRTIAIEHNPNEMLRVSYMVGAGGKRGIKLPPGYYGNAYAMPSAISKAELVCKNPLGYALELVRKIKTQMSEEYMRSVADYMVIKGRPHYSTAGHFIVADSSRVPFREIDFGWGKPVYAGVAKAAPNMSFCVRFKKSTGEDGILIQMSLPLQAMDRFQKELAKFTGERPMHVTGDKKHTFIKSML